MLDLAFLNQIKKRVYLYLDGKVTDCAQKADYTTQRAAKIDYLDVSVLSRAPESSALSTIIWTNALAAALGGLKKGPQIKNAANGIISGGLETVASGTNYFSAGDTVLSQDKKKGYRVACNVCSASLTDIVNQVMSGWLLGVGQFFFDIDTRTYSAQMIITIDGVTLCDTTYLGGFCNGKGNVPIGYVEGGKPRLDPNGLRVNNSLRIQHRGSELVRTNVVWRAD